MHQLGHATDEAAEWNAEAAEARKGGGLRDWLEFRDGPFNKQAKQQYS
jgi:hypothetical protein